MRHATVTLFCLHVSLTVSMAAEITTLAGPVTNLANGHIYYLLSSATWSNSEAHAVQMGGHLATVDDAMENAWIAATFSVVGGQQRPLWIGLTDRQREDEFLWVSGAPARYFNWNRESGEPNNAAGAGYEEDFAYIIENNPQNPSLIPGQWNDAPDTGYGVNHPVCGVVELEPGSGGSAPAPAARWVDLLLLVALGFGAVVALLIAGLLIGLLLWRRKRPPGP